MAFTRVGVRDRARRQPVVDVPPVVRRNVSRIDAQRLDGIDRLQHAFDLRPAVYPQQTLPAGADKADRRTGLARTNGAQDVDTRDDGAKIVRRPADESEDVARRERDGAATRGSMICSEATRPKRIQRWTRFSIQIRST